MEEGANQGCPLSATLADFVLGEVLKPLDAAMKAREPNRFLDAGYDNGDDGAGGESHPMRYIDDIGTATPHFDMFSSFRSSTTWEGHLDSISALVKQESRLQLVVVPC